MNIASTYGLLFGAVVDGLVLLLRSPQRLGKRGVICHNDFHVLADVLSDVLCQRALCILSMEEPQFTATLPNADYTSLLSLQPIHS